MRLVLALLVVDRRRFAQVDKEDYPYLDLRVDEHADPVAELARVYEVAETDLLPLVSMMPTKENPAGSFDPEEARRAGLLKD